MLSFITNLFAKGRELQVGDRAPQLPPVADETGASDAMKYGPGYTLVYFYPKADTPGCTAQACSLRDAFTDLTQKGVTVYGVSTDKPETQKKFKEKYRLPFHLIADTEKSVAKAFGVPVHMGFSSRQAFLLKNEKVVWLDRTASTKEQAADVLKYMTENQ